MNSLHLCVVNKTAHFRNLFNVQMKLVCLMSTMHFPADWTHNSDPCVARRNVNLLTAMRWSPLAAFVYYIHMGFYCRSENPVHHSCVVILNYYHIHAHIIVSWFLIIAILRQSNFRAKDHAQKVIMWIVCTVLYVQSLIYEMRMRQAIDYYFTLMFLSFNFRFENFDVKRMLHRTHFNGNGIKLSISVVVLDSRIQHI